MKHVGIFFAFTTFVCYLLCNSLNAHERVATPRVCVRIIGSMHRTCAWRTTRLNV